MQYIGRYEVTRELGRGAMGVVYAAIDPLIGREVAIKTIRMDNLGDETARGDLTRRLFREAQSAGILSHPGIITIYDIGESGNDAYIVMEFVAGKTLEEVLAAGVPQPSATLLSILNQAAEALDYAHRKGIVHRDIKPSNLMISENGTVKIADFGVAKLATSTSLTQAGFVLGTPSYMSPEQAQGKQIDGRADQFSLAVVAFRMMTGKLPFDGPTLTALLTKILWEEPEYANSGLLPALKPAFERALAKNPQIRFQFCADFVRELESGYAQHKAELHSRAAAPALRSAAEPNIPEREIPNEQEPPAPEPVLQEIPVEKKSGKLLWVACAGLAILAMAAILYLVRTPADNPAPALPMAESPTKARQHDPVLPEKPAKVREEAAPVQTVNPDVAPKPKSVPSQASRTAAEMPKPISPVVQKPAPPISGTLTWSGNLTKNSILVIDAQTASVGTVTGDALPGYPVLIEVDPKEVIIRQMPNEANGWRQIMLYSGSSKYSSISVHWTGQKH